MTNNCINCNVDSPKKKKIKVTKKIPGVAIDVHMWRSLVFFGYPPNCLDLRPVLKYWAIIKRKLKKIKLNVKHADEFKRKWIQVPEKQSDDARSITASVNGKGLLYWTT